ncbi:MAG: type II toxin-antitoxin system VapC family toxin [Promethearchaeota archaeon]
MKYLVLLDANFLFLPEKYHVDIVRECEDVVPGEASVVLLRRVLEELEKKLERTRSKTLERQLRVIREYIRRRGLNLTDDPLPGGGLVDDRLLEYAELVKSPVLEPVIATNDKELRQRARARGIPQITLRNQKFLIFQY